MRWRKDNFNLTLSCIADNLEHKVTFYDYLNIEQAFCIVSFPDPICHSYLEASDIRQNLTTNETIFVIQNVSKEYKAGRWTCSHGSNNEEAMTDIKSTAIGKFTMINDCTKADCTILIVCQGNSFFILILNK